MKASLLENQALIYKKNGQKLNFYISNNSIYYITFNNNAVKKVKLIEDIKNYDITLDSSDNIHLVCTTYKGELAYLYFSENKWKRKMLMEYDPQKRQIDFLNILNIQNMIHIFYSFKIDGNKKMYKLFHLYNIGDKWEYTYLSPITLEIDTKPYFIDFNKNGDIYFLYKTIDFNKYKIYIKVFSHINNKWTQKREINFDKDNIDIVNFFIDTEDNIHFVYEQRDSICYLFHTSTKIYEFKSKSLLKNLITSIDSNKLLCNIFQIGNRIWISWKERDTVCYCYSDDFGEKWSQKEVYGSGDLYNIKYIDINNENLLISKPISAFAFNKNNATYILGINNELTTDKENIEHIEKLEDNENMKSCDLGNNDDTSNETIKSDNYLKENERTDENINLNDRHKNIVNTEENLENFSNYEKSKIDENELNDVTEANINEKPEEVENIEVEENTLISNIEQENNSNEDNNSNKTFVQKLIDFLTNK